MTDFNAKLTFLNHASFMIEGNDAVLLIDPWYEGAAFNQGWNLLDASVKNEDVIKKLIYLNKKIFIWLSHEHSDHFSVPFIKKLKNVNIDITFLYQKTLDNRVQLFLKKEGLKILELNDGCSFEMDADFEIRIWKYHSGDSYCLIRCSGLSILNLNDCVVSSPEEALKISKNISDKIDLLFTQFGYANWVGNEADIDYRSIIAQEKFKRIRVQADIFTPAYIIPFASFVYFSHPDNFYLNDLQNTPEKLRLSDKLKTIQDNIFFMKPYDALLIEKKIEMRNNLEILTKQAEQHWNGLFKNIQPKIQEDKIISLESLRKKFNKYFIKILLNFLVVPLFLEFISFIVPLRIRISDLMVTVEISYIKGFRVLANSAPYDISLKSNLLDYILSNDYGYNSTSVNGRYRTQCMEANAKFGRFFSPQEYLKNGYGLLSLINSVLAFRKKFIN